MEASDLNTSVTTSSDGSSDVNSYLEQHKLLPLIENLTSAVLYAQPDDPKEFIANWLQELINARASTSISPPSLVEDSNLESLYNMLDITQRGVINAEQYKAAMSSLGVKSYNTTPLGATTDRISKETFLNEAQAALTHANSTYQEH
ncbi:hypothetical protein LOD99_12753 [Oopsacas minuta]|uniref:EF-hand domain-containing protein n=1 Tax=Oopsacas minuta TaxID=111878 RepID=A0AAV7JCZ3_9METZ|nr:hypothetical protein LOD99_12753 [Oopsacas minuta]